MAVETVHDRSGSVRDERLTVPRQAPRRPIVTGRVGWLQRHAGVRSESEHLATPLSNP